MIFKPTNPFHPPYGRIDEVIYYGAVAMSFPLMPVAYDEVGLILDRWDSASSSWLPVPIDDSQLSADVVLAPGAVLPVLDGSNLTGVVHQQPQGSVTTLDGAGHLTITLTNPTLLASLIACWYNAAGVGQLFVTNQGGGTWWVDSSAGAADAGAFVSWLAL